MRYEKGRAGAHSMTFQDYYCSKFQADFAKFAEHMPVEHKHHGDENVVTVQPWTLSRESNYIDTMNSDDVLNFALSLFFVVLVDEVMYTYYPKHYDGFQKATMFPKYIGNCFSACHVHMHPKSLFHDIRQHGRWKTHDWIIQLREAISSMKEECDYLIDSHAPEINKAEFWSRCLNEFPSCKPPLTGITHN